jgi:hypothetical protein
VDSDSLDVLIGALGQRNQPVASQQEALRDWLGSASARPAPKTLLRAVRKFLEVPVAE